MWAIRHGECLDKSSIPQNAQSSRVCLRPASLACYTHTEESPPNSEYLRPTVQDGDIRCSSCHFGVHTFQWTLEIEPKAIGRQSSSGCTGLPARLHGRATRSLTELSALHIDSFLYPRQNFRLLQEMPEPPLRLRRRAKPAKARRTRMSSGPKAGEARQGKVDRRRASNASSSSVLTLTVAGLMQPSEGYPQLSQSR